MPSYVLVSASAERRRVKACVRKVRISSFTFVWLLQEEEVAGAVEQAQAGMRDCRWPACGRSERAIPCRLSRSESGLGHASGLRRSSLLQPMGDISWRR